MLYHRWRQIAESFSDRLAIRDLTTGREWTFREVASAIENEPCTRGPIAFPHGSSAEFVFGVLRAWRDRRAVCPLESGQAVPSLAATLPSDVAHLKTTSATTGAPRLVAFTAPQLMADASNIVTTMGLKPEWPNLGVISLAHSYGFSNLLLPLLLHGIPLILVGAALPEAVRRAAATAEAVTLPAVPTLWGRWHEADAIPRNVRLAISAGAPLPIRLEESIFGQRNLKIHNFYGSTECGGIAYDPSAVPRTDGSLAGVPLTNVAVSVNGDGCLQIRGEAVGQTYWPEPGPELRNGLFRTSDLAEISEGVVYLRGRAGDQINVAGRKVLPEAIEEVLRAHPSVRECVAFGAPSPEMERGEIIVACLTTREKMSSDILKQFLMTKLPAWQVPREWWFVDSVAANERGKLSRTEWRRRYLEAAKRGPNQANQ